MSEHSPLAEMETEAATRGSHGSVPAAAPQTLGRYTIERELGRGGMGVVYAALDPELQRRVALKLLTRRETPEARERFLREARALARLAHPNVVTVYEIGTAGDQDFIAMELVDGHTLADWLREGRRASTDMLDAFVAAGRGLEAAHAAGLVHRDFKPHNVLREHGGRIRVTDFGLASALEHAMPTADERGVANDQEVSLDRLTVTGAWIGTPAYMAPEQWAGGDITTAVDQFAFCVALWEAFAGARPFRGDSLEELRSAVESGTSELASTSVPRRMRDILARGLERDPARRWPDMATLLAALERRRHPRRRVPWAAVAVAVAVLAAATSVVIVVARRPAASENRDDSADLQQQVTRIADGSVHASAAAILKLRDELASLRTARFVPAGDSTGAVGLKLFNVRPSSLLDAVGISNGDLLIGLDGTPVRTPEQVQRAAAQLSPHGFRLELLRKGTPATIDVRER